MTSFFYQLFTSYITCNPLICSPGNRLLPRPPVFVVNLITASESASVIFHQAKLFGHTSICWQDQFTTLVQTEVSGQLLDGLTWDLVQTLKVPRGYCKSCKLWWLQTHYTLNKKWCMAKAVFLQCGEQQFRVRHLKCIFVRNKTNAEWKSIYVTTLRVILIQSGPRYLLMLRCHRKLWWSHLITLPHCNALITEIQQGDQSYSTM